jgi:hypothetical protein
MLHNLVCKFRNKKTTNTWLVVFLGFVALWAVETTMVQLHDRATSQ